MHPIISSFLFSWLLLIATGNNNRQIVQATPDRPTISFTFDDGVTNDMPGYRFPDWNTMLLQHLQDENVHAVFFVTGANKADKKGRLLLDSWDHAGHRIGNHTYTHPSYADPAMTFETFREEFLRTDSIIRAYHHFIPLFRFPYLKEGDTETKIRQFRTFLAEQGYKNGHVTIDASDWYIDGRLRDKLKRNPKTDLKPFRQFYLDHLLDRARYYESLAYELTGRHIHHTLLLHHNLTSALFVGDLIRMFRAQGWDVVDADQAFSDPVFDAQPTNVPAGESLIWALAKQSGKYDQKLRYPAEDGDYEKEKMDRLGL